MLLRAAYKAAKGLKLILTDAAGNTRVVRRQLRIPAAG